MKVWRLKEQQLVKQVATQLGSRVQNIHLLLCRRKKETHETLSGLISFNGMYLFEV